MRKHIIDRDILPIFQDRLLTENKTEDFICRTRRST
jgi:hypothetical protein